MPEKIKPPLPAWFDPLITRYGEDAVRRVLESTTSKFSVSVLELSFEHLARELNNYRVPTRSPTTFPPPESTEEGPEYQVWAIEYEHRTPTGGLTLTTVAVSAESEYGAVKRLVGNRPAVIKRVELIKGRKPVHDQRRIEGSTDYEIQTGDLWEYT